MITEKYSRKEQTVYIINPYQGVLQGKIDSFTNNQGIEWIKVLLQCEVCRDGSKGKHTVVGSIYAKTEDCFLTLEEAYAEIDRRERKQIEKYLDEMKTLEDLIRFPLEHDFCEDEYTEKAYKIKAKEFGFLMNEYQDLEDEDASLRRER